MKHEGFELGEYISHKITGEVWVYRNGHSFILGNLVCFDDIKIEDGYIDFPVENYLTIKYSLGEVIYTLFNLSRSSADKLENIDNVYHELSTTNTRWRLISMI